MTRHDGGDLPPVVPLRPGGTQRTTGGAGAGARAGRRSRISEARGYHPRGRTVGEAASDPPPRRTTAGAPLRAVADPDQPGAGRAGSGRTAGSRTANPRSANPRSANPRSANPRSANPRSAKVRAGRSTRDAGRSARDAGRGSANRRSANARIRASAPAPGTGPADGRPPFGPPPLADQRRRLRIATALVLTLFGVIAGRLIQLQVTDAPAYAAAGLAERLQTVEVPAPRGSILDRNGAVLAGSVEARYVYADPALVEDPVGAAGELASVLGVPRSELLPKLMPHRHSDGRAVRFEYLARGVPVDMGDRVAVLQLPGIGVRRDESRSVPGHDLAANIIGFTGRDLTGLAGLEASYDDLLRGVDGRRTFEIGQPDGDISLDHEIPGGYREETPARPGTSLQLTVDQDLQFEVQRILGQRLKQARATTGAAVVLDVRTGEVLAQASYPSYDAANPLAAKPAHRGDAATGLAVEPGSVHKAIVVAACLQEGVVGPQDSVLVGPKVVKGGTPYTDKGHYHAKPTAMTLPGILAWSSNVGTIALADRLGAQKLYEYQRAFGLGEITGVGLPGESAGLVQPPQNWSESSYGSIPIGHGVSVTPLQMAAVYAAIANGGVWVRPHLVQAVVGPDGIRTPAPPAPSRRVISPENALALRTMLEAVVTVPGATGLSARVPGYRVAGKTGTGLMIVDGRFARGEVASFIGMAPADAPRYVIAVFAHTPGGTGGDIAGPAFAEMMEHTLLHYKVPPSRTKPPKLAVYP